MILLETEKNLINGIVDGIVDGIRHVNKINIFDFDGTIFNSPVPNRGIWDSKTYGRLMGDSSRGGLGWFQHTITLDDKYIGDSNFNEDVVADVRKSMNDPNTATILLTGRDTSFSGQIKRILSSADLVFDDFGFKPEPKDGEIRETTMNFKKRFIKEMLSKYGADKIEMWEDRQKHVITFDEYLDALGVNAGVNFIDRPETHMKPELERELVSQLLPNSPKFESADRQPTYWDVMLNSDSYDALMNAFNSIIPNGWTIYAHHMTMLFGKNKNDLVKNYIDTNIGETVDLMAVAIGVSNDAIAVQIQSSVPSDNKIPHVTLATPPRGKAFNSNLITDWKKLETPIKLSGIISAFR